MYNYISHHLKKLKQHLYRTFHKSQYNFRKNSTSYENKLKTSTKQIVFSVRIGESDKSVKKSWIPLDELHSFLCSLEKLPIFLKHTI